MIKEITQKKSFKERALTQGQRRSLFHENSPSQSITQSLILLMITLCGAPSILIAKTDDSVEIAQKNIQRGIELIKSKDYKNAAIALDTSYRASPSLEVLHLLGRLYDKQPLECRRSLSSWRLMQRSCDEGCALREESLNKLKTAQDECEGSIDLTSDPSGAEVFIDQQPVGATPIKLKVTGGQVQLKVYISGFKMEETTIHLERSWGNKRHHFVLDVATPLSKGIFDTKPANRGQITPSPTHSATPSSAPSVMPSSAPSATPSSAPSVASAQESQSLISSQFSNEEDPFTRMGQVAQIDHGRVAISGGVSMIADLRCEYRTRFQKYISLPKCDNARLAMFDRFYIAFIPQQDLYIYLVMSNSSGQWQLLFPAPDEDNKFKRGQLASLPKKEWILFDHMRDVEDKISLLASLHPIKELERQRGRMNQMNFPLEVLRYFVAMSNEYQREEGVLKSRPKVPNVSSIKMDHQALHISFNVLR